MHTSLYINQSVRFFTPLKRKNMVFILLCFEIHKVWWDPSEACALSKNDSCSLKEGFVGGPLNLETIVASSYYLLEIQLHNPTVKLPSLYPSWITRNKASIDIALQTLQLHSVKCEVIKLLA